MNLAKSTPKIINQCHIHIECNQFISIENQLSGFYFNPIQDGLFRGCLRMGGLFGPLPKIRDTYPTMMKLSTVNLPKVDQKNV